MTKRTTETTAAKASPLMVRLDAESKQALIAAAELRRISVSDYVRTVTVAQGAARSPAPAIRQSCSAPMSNSRSGRRCKRRRNSRGPRNNWRRSCGDKSERSHLSQRQRFPAGTAAEKSPAPAIRLWPGGRQRLAPYQGAATPRETTLRHESLARRERRDRRLLHVGDGPGRFRRSAVRPRAQVAPTAHSPWQSSPGWG